MIDDIRQSEFDRELARFGKWCFILGVIVGVMLTWLIIILAQ